MTGLASNRFSVFARLAHFFFKLTFVGIGMATCTG
jgi:hypothetical protein